MADTIGTSVIRILDANGDPVPGAKAYFYDSGTTTPRIVYQDVAAAVPHASPVVADSSGILPPIYATVAVKMTVTTSTGASVPGYPVDPAAKIASTGSAASAVSFSPTIPIPVTNAQAAIETVQANMTAAVQSLTKWQTPQAATSGTVFDFLGIPAWATEIIISFQSISLSGTDHILVQAGTSAGVFTTAYSVSGSIDAATAASVSSATGFVIYHGTAADSLVGEMRLIKPDPSANTWLSNHNCARGSQKVSQGAGTVGLPGVLDRVRITRTGSNTFDGASSSINVGWR